MDFLNDPEHRRTLVGLIVSIALVAVVVVYARRRMATQDRRGGRYAEIAHITETIETTGFGGFCLVMLLITQVACVIQFAVVKSAIQEASIGALWIAGNVLWGLGVALGRRRTYRIWREIPEPPTSS